MAVTFKQLAAVDLTTTNVTVIYTVPASTTVHIKRLQVTSRDTVGNANTIDIWYTNDGTQDNTNLMYNDLSLDGKETFRDRDWAYLPATGTIEMQASAANIFTIIVYGVEFS